MMADITREDEVHCRLIQKCDPNLYEDQHILQPGTETGVAGQTELKFGCNLIT
jgi:hypothetical protein